MSQVPVLDAAGLVSTTQWGLAASASTANLNDLPDLNALSRDLPTFQGDPTATEDSLSQLEEQLTEASEDPAFNEATGNPRFNHTPKAWWSAILALVAITVAILIATALALRRYDYV